MKRKHLFLTMMLMLFMSFQTYAQQSITFIWKGSTTPKTIQTRIGYDVDGLSIDWGEGTVTTHSGTGTYFDINSPAYPNENDYTVVMTATRMDVNITYLAIDDYEGLTQVSSIDLSNAPQLTQIYLSYNELTSIDVSNNLALEILYVDNNQLTNIDVSQNTALTGLGCYNNQIADLDVSNNPLLTTLQCGYNQLTTLDVSINTALNQLQFENNQISNIDLSNNTAISYLHAGDNQFTNIDISNNTALKMLYVSYNQLQTLDVSNNMLLTHLYCQSNQLTDITKSTSSYNALRSFHCHANQFVNLDLTKFPNIIDLQCQNNQLTDLDLTENTALTTLYCYNNAIPWADLKAASDISTLVTQNNRRFGTQTLATVDWTSSTATLDAVFNGVGTNFAVKFNRSNAVDGTDYTITDGIITFLNNGLYEITMTNDALVSHASYPAKVIATYDVTIPFTDALYFGEGTNSWSLYTDSGLTAEFTTGKGTTWTPEANKLTLNGFNFTTTEDYALTLKSDLEIVLVEGSINSIISGEVSTNAIHSYYNLTLTGTGTLNLQSGFGTSYSEAICIIGKTVEIDGPTVNATSIGGNNGSIGVALYSSGNLIMKSGTLNATASVGTNGVGLQVAGTTTITGGTIVATGSNKAVSLNTGFDASSVLALGKKEIDDVSTEEATFDSDAKTYKIDGDVVKYLELTELTVIPEIKTAGGALAIGYIGVPYNATIETANTPISFSVSSGSLPDGLSISNAGVISGTPTTEEIATFEITATNVIGTSAAVEYTIEIIELNDFTLYLGDGANGWSLYSDDALTIEYTGKPGKWSASANQLTLNGFSFVTSATRALSLPESTTLIIADETTNTIAIDNTSMAVGNYALYADGDFTIMGGSLNTGVLNVNVSGGGTASAGIATNYEKSPTLIVDGITVNINVAGITGQNQVGIYNYPSNVGNESQTTIRNGATIIAEISGTNTMGFYIKNLTVEATCYIELSATLLAIVASSGSTVTLNDLPMNGTVDGNKENLLPVTLSGTQFIVGGTGTQAKYLVIGTLTIPKNIYFTWKGKTTGKTIRIKATAGTDNITVDWGNGNEETFDGNDDTTVAMTHIYGDTNEYDVVITIEVGTDVTYLDVSDNELSELDITEIEELEELYCNGNDLETLDVSKNGALEILYCYDNALQFADLKGASDKISIKNNKRLGTQILPTKPWTTTTALIDDVFNGVGTTFEVTLDGEASVSGTDYNITGGTITFKKGGLYRITIKNAGIESHDSYPAQVIDSYQLTLNQDASLSNLTISQGALTPGFAPGTFSYSATVNYSTTSIEIAASATTGSSTVTGTGVKTLVIGLNTFNIVVTAQDNNVTQTYVVQIYRQSNDATLSNITISQGTLSPTFASGTLNYTVAVGFDATTIEIVATSNHASATVVGDGVQTLAIGNNTFNIVVTPEDNTMATQTYTIVVRRQLNDATLSSLIITPGILSPAFVSGVTAYTVELDNEITSVQITATATDAAATVTGTGTIALTAGANTLNVVVIAEDNTYTANYIITVIRPSYTITASVSSIGGIITPSGDVEVNVGESQTFTIEASEGYAIDQVLVDGQNSVSAVMTGEYTFNNVNAIHTIIASFRTLSTDATLSNIIINTGELSPVFDPNIFNYDVTVPYETTNITITCVANGIGAMIHNEGTFNLNVGNNTIALRVVAEDGQTELTYRIYVNRASNGSDDTFLASLSVNQGTLTPFFNKNITNYTVNVSNETTQLTINATASSNLATVSGTGAKQLIAGENMFVVTVKAQNGSTRYYTINVYRGLHTIVASVNGAGGSIDPEGTFEYEEGATETFTLAAENGFQIKRVLIDGVNNANAISEGTYTFENITASHTIVVEFETKPTGLNEDAIHFAVYPNPVTDNVTIESSANNPIERIQLYDLSGYLLQEQYTSQTKVSFDLSSYANGTYILNVDNKHLKIVKR